MGTSFTYAVFQIQLDKKANRKEVKQMILNGIDRQDLVFFSFTDEEIEALEWEHSEEFEFQDMMYDVVERKRIGDKTEFWCWQDDKESESNKALESLVAKFITDFGEEDKEDGITRLMSNLYFNTHKEFQIHTYHYVLNNHSNYYIDLKSNFAASPPVPPPEFY